MLALDFCFIQICSGGGVDAHLKISLQVPMQELSKGQEIQHTSTGTRTWENKHRKHGDMQPFASAHPPVVPGGPAWLLPKISTSLCLNTRFVQQTPQFERFPPHQHLLPNRDPRLLGKPLSPIPCDCYQICINLSPRNVPNCFLGRLELLASTVSFDSELCGSVVPCARKIFPLFFLNLLSNNLYAAPALVLSDN